jgi:ankyrin repeat protein
MNTIRHWKGMLAAGLLAVATGRGWAEDLVQERFRKALLAEEADQDLAAAIRGYESVLEAAETPLRNAATALYRLGECHRKLGRISEAAVAFGRLAREFPAQTNLVRLARQNLAALGMATSATDAPAVPVAPVAAVERDPEDVEIERLRALEKDAPDLIFRGSVGGVSPIESAVAQGQVRVVEYLLDRKVPLSDPARSATLLESAVVNGRLRMVDLLLRRGADVNETSTSGKVLHLAILRRLPAITDRLLEAKPDLEARSSSEMPPGLSQSTALGLAVQLKDRPMVEKLLARGAQPKYLLLEAVKTGDADFVGLLIRAGLDPKMDPNLSPSISQVILQARPEPLLRLLVSAGLDINLSNTAAHTLLCAVALTRSDSESLARLLLELGADPNRQSLGRTPLGIALQTGNAGLVKLLLEKGADPKQTGTANEEKVPIVLRAYLASKVANDLGILEVILATGASPDVLHEGYIPETLFNWTQLGFLNGPSAHGLQDRRALGLAASLGDLDAVRLLLARGSSPTLRDRGGRTVLHGLPRQGIGGSAEFEQNLREIWKLLLEAGVPDPQDPRAGGSVSLRFGGRTEVLPLKKGQTNWLSAVVGEALKGQGLASSVSVERGSPSGGSHIWPVPLSRISRPGDPGDFELLDLDMIQVQVASIPPSVRAAPPAPAISNPPGLAPPPAP